MFFIRVSLVVLCVYALYSNAMESAVIEACRMRIIPEDTPKIFRERLVIKNGMPYKIRIVYDDLLTKDGQPTSPVVAIIPPEGEYILVDPYTVNYLHVEASGKLKSFLNVRSYVNLLEKLDLAKPTFQKDVISVHVLLTIRPGTVSYVSSVPLLGSVVGPYVAPFNNTWEALSKRDLMDTMAIADNPCLREAFPCARYAQEVDGVVAFPKHYLGLSLQGKTVLDEQRSLAEEFARLTRLWALCESHHKETHAGVISEPIAQYFACVKQILQSAYNLLCEQKSLLAKEYVTLTKIGLPLSLIGRVTIHDDTSLQQAIERLRNEWKAALESSIPEPHTEQNNLVAQHSILWGAITALLKKEAAFVKVGTMLNDAFTGLVDVSPETDYILKKKCGISE